MIKFNDKTFWLKLTNHFGWYEPKYGKLVTSEVRSGRNGVTARIIQNKKLS